MKILIKWWHYARIGLLPRIILYRLRHPTGPMYAAWTPRGWRVAGHQDF